MPGKERGSRPWRVCAPLRSICRATCCGVGSHSRCALGVYEVFTRCKVLVLTARAGLCACGWSPCGAVRRMSGCAGGEGGRKRERHRVSRPHSAVACCRFCLLYCFWLSLSSFVSVCGDCTGSLYTPAIRICPRRASAIFDDDDVARDFYLKNPTPPGAAQAT